MPENLGHRRMFLAGLTVFTGASLVAGAAQGAAALIAARGLQGLAAALLGPAALSPIAITFTEAPERNRAFGLLGAVGGVTVNGRVVLGGLPTRPTR